MHTVKPAQRRTLEVGSCLVLGGLGLEFQFGGWPVWTFLLGIGLYAAWVLLYAEMTVQANRRRSLGRQANGKLASHAPLPDPLP